MSVLFALELVRDFILQSLLRILTLVDLVCLSSWSPVWFSPGNEPFWALADTAVYIRVVTVNFARSFRNSASIWPDAIVSISTLFSVVILGDILADSTIFYVSIVLIASEFLASVFSADRRRQRKLWAHNASFRITQFRRNPFQRSIRRSLLRPLLKRRTNEEPASPTAHPVDLKVGGKLVSSFIDIIPETRGHNPEKRILHVHCLVSSPVENPNLAVVFLHQFGSGAFTWQSVMTELVESIPNANLIAFDRLAHGLTFPSEPLLPERDALMVDVTPADEMREEPVNFYDIVNSPDYDVELVDSVIDQTSGGAGNKIVIVACGGAGAKLALSYMNRSVRQNKVAGLILVSPYMMATDGIPSVLRSIASAQVGRALLVSMAKSEVTDVILRRSWESKHIPGTLVEAHKKAVEMPNWEEAMAGVLKRAPIATVDPSTVQLPILVIGGEKDHFINDLDEYRAISTQFPNGTFASVSACGASPQEERPRETATIITSFILSL